MRHEELVKLIREKAVVYPDGAQLGDENVEMVNVSIEVAYFDDMPDDEIVDFVVAQFPEHEWGQWSGWDIDNNGIIDVTMFEDSVLARCNDLIDRQEAFKALSHDFEHGSAQQELTPEACLAVIQESGIMLKYVPEQFKTPELCHLAVQRHGWALQYVPEAMKTPELYLSAVKNLGSALQYVPERFKTQEMCLMAVQAVDCALAYIPEEFKTQELCRAAVHGAHSRPVLQYVPEEQKTEELCLIAVQKSWLEFEYVPMALKTPEFCRAAVQKRKYPLRHVPDYLKEFIIPVPSAA